MILTRVAMRNEIMATYLYTMIVSISNDVLSYAVDGDASKTVEFTFTATILSKLFHENAIGIKHLKHKTTLDIARAYLSQRIAL